jgi:hypothetical protein
VIAGNPVNQFQVLQPGHSPIHHKGIIRPSDRELKFGWQKYISVFSSDGKESITHTNRNAALELNAFPGFNKPSIQKGAVGASQVLNKIATCFPRDPQMSPRNVFVFDLNVGPGTSSQDHHASLQVKIGLYRRLG